MAQIVNIAEIPIKRTNGNIDIDFEEVNDINDRVAYSRVRQMVSINK